MDYPERSIDDYKARLLESYVMRNLSKPIVETPITRNGGFPFRNTLDAITEQLRKAIESGTRPWDIRSFFADIDIKKLPAAGLLVQASFPFDGIPAGSRARDLTEFAHAAIYEYFLAKEYRRDLFKTDAANLRWLLSRNMQPVAKEKYFVQHPKVNTLHISWADGMYIWKKIPGPDFEEHVAELRARKMEIRGRDEIQQLIKLITHSPAAQLSSPRIPPGMTYLAYEVAEKLPRLIRVCIFIMSIRKSKN